MVIRNIVRDFNFLQYANKHVAMGQYLADIEIAGKPRTIVLAQTRMFENLGGGGGGDTCITHTSEAHGSFHRPIVIVHI